MTLQEVLDYFEKNYPNANVVKLPEDNPLELLCEIDPASGHPGYSVAIAAVSASKAHKHVVSTEEYEVIHGSVLISTDGQIRTLYEREKVIIKPGVVHSATSVTDYALVKVTSQPGWTQEDHILV